MKIEEKIINTLIDIQKTLAIAESCTGGLLAHRLTNISGCSQVLKLGVIAYSNESKIKLLKISNTELTKYGAVHEKIAVAMAKGVRKILKTDFGIGITGIAGPTGATKTKPIGLTYIAIATPIKTLCLKSQFKGTRAKIKSQATTQGLKLLFELILSAKNKL